MSQARVLGTMIKRRQFGTRQPGETSQNVWSRFCTDNRTFQKQACLCWGSLVAGFQVALARLELGQIGVPRTQPILTPGTCSLDWGASDRQKLRIIKLI